MECPTAKNSNTHLFPKSYEIIERHRKVAKLTNHFYVILVSAKLDQPRSKKSTGKGHSNKRSKENSLSFHSLRHTATSLLKNTGASEAAAIDIIGHDTKAISSIYTHTLKTVQKGKL